MAFTLVAWPAWRQQAINDNQWLTLQKRFAPWVNGSIALLWISGFYQMTNSSHYNGFMVLDSAWAVAMLVKHIAVLGMMACGLLVHWRIHPQMERLMLLQQSKPTVAQNQQAELANREIRLLRLNLACAVFVLLFTAIATAA